MPCHAQCKPQSIAKPLSSELLFTLTMLVGWDMRNALFALSVASQHWRRMPCQQRSQPFDTRPPSILLVIDSVVSVHHIFHPGLRLDRRCTHHHLVMSTRHTSGHPLPFSYLWLHCGLGELKHTHKWSKRPFQVSVLTVSLHSRCPCYKSHAQDAKEGEFHCEVSEMQKAR